MDIRIDEIEDRWRRKWQEMNLYAFRMDDRPVYSMDIPPPTISGSLHMGHAFSYPHQDFVARYKRMRGFNVYYQFGFDDNGLPTEKFTEKATGRKGKNTPLSEFIGLCKTHSEQAEEKMVDLFMKLGISSDFSDYYRTISESSVRISQKAFIDLAKSGRAYSAIGPTIKCPVCGTAISQIELKDKKFRTDFVHLRFGSGDTTIEIATTRPEMLAACVAVFVNPGDSRYSKMIGRTISVPVYNHSVPVIADDFVRTDVGTGAEMVCTFGDQNDMYLWRKHSLPARMIITPEGTIDDSRGPLSGLRINDARKAVIERLKSDGYVMGIERIEHSVNVHERCDTPVEIGIEKQWFIRVLDIIPQLLESGSRINWIPPHMKVRYENWINGLKWDWCISRQRFYGVPFPVWYCRDCGEIMYADESELPVDPRTAPPRKCQKCGSENTTGDSDIMDTWATSSLSPKISLSRHSLQENEYPMDMRFQAHDIISTWTFTTILRALIHDGNIPWKNILLSGIVSDPTGAKMSKSRGNITDPEEVMQQYGADALRFWASSSLPWDDIRFKEQEIVRGRRTIIKMHNAARLLVMHAENAGVHDITGSGSTKYARWILKKYSELLARVTPLMDDYMFSKARTEMDSFFWNVYCDHYLEIIKHISRSGGGGKDDVLNAGFYVILQLLKMYSPLIPFTTEEIYSSLPAANRKESIHLESWPESAELEEYSEAEAEIDYVTGIVSLIRSEKAKANRRPQSETRVSLGGSLHVLREHRELIEGLSGVTVADIEESGEPRVSLIND